MKRRWRLWVPIILAALVLFILALDRLNRVYWLGRTDLEVQFVVTDADTGQPIQDATVSIQAKDVSFYRERDEDKAFTLRTDRDGVAHRVCHDDRCIGEVSGLRFTNTFNVYLPGWLCEASAPKYEPSQPFLLDTPYYDHQVVRVGVGATKLVVPIAISSAAGQPPAQKE